MDEQSAAGREVNNEHECTIGVGDGDGQLFVHGSYEAVKRVQSLFLSISSLKRERDEERSRMCAIKKQLEGVVAERDHLRDDLGRERDTVAKCRVLVETLKEQTAEYSVFDVAATWLENILDGRNPF